MPDDEDLADAIGGHRAAVQAGAVVHDIALRLEAGAGVRQPRVEDDPAVAVLGAHHSGSGPGDVHAAVSPEREVAAAHRAGGDRAALA